MKKKYAAPEVQYFHMSSMDIIQSSAIVMEEIDFRNLGK